MQIKTTRFDVLNYSPQDLIHFPAGLLGFEELKDYLVIPMADSDAFFWLQSVEQGEIAFLVTEPFKFFSDYEIQLGDNLKKKLSITQREQVAVYTTVTIPQTGVKDMTANLIGPLIINLDNRRGIQYVLEGDRYHTKHRLFKDKMEQKAGE